MWNNINLWVMEKIVAIAFNLAWWYWQTAGWFKRKFKMNNSNKYKQYKQHTQKVVPMCTPRTKAPVPMIPTTEWRYFGGLWVAATYAEHSALYDPTIHFAKCTCGLGIRINNFPKDVIIPNTCRYVCRACGEHSSIVNPKLHLEDLPTECITLSISHANSNGGENVGYDYDD